MFRSSSSSTTRCSTHWRPDSRSPRSRWSSVAWWAPLVVAVVGAVVGAGDQFCRSSRREPATRGVALRGRRDSPSPSPHGSSGSEQRIRFAVASGIADRNRRPCRLSGSGARAATSRLDAVAAPRGRRSTRPCRRSSARSSVSHSRPPSGANRSASPLGRWRSQVSCCSSAWRCRFHAADSMRRLRSTSPSAVTKHRARQGHARRARRKTRAGSRPSHGKAAASSAADMIDTDEPGVWVTEDPVPVTGELEDAAAPAHGRVDGRGPRLAARRPRDRRRGGPCCRSSTVPFKHEQQYLLREQNGARTVVVRDRRSTSCLPAIALSVDRCAGRRRPEDHQPTRTNALWRTHDRRRSSLSGWASGGRVERRDRIAVCTFDSSAAELHELRGDDGARRHARRARATRLRSTSSSSRVGSTGFFVAHADLDDLTKIGRGEPVEGDPGALVPRRSRCSSPCRSRRSRRSTVRRTAAGARSRSRARCGVIAASGHMGQPEVARRHHPRRGRNATAPTADRPGTRRRAHPVADASSAPTRRVAIGLANAVLPDDGFIDHVSHGSQPIARNTRARTRRGEAGDRRRASGWRSKTGMRLEGQFSSSCRQAQKPSSSKTATLDAYAEGARPDLGRTPRTAASRRGRPSACASRDRRTRCPNPSRGPSPSAT